MAAAHQIPFDSYKEPASPPPPRRKFRWLWFIPVTLIVLILAALAVLHSARFHRYVLSMLTNNLQEASGGRTEIGDYRIHWHGLKVDMDRVVIHGTETDPQNPLFRTDLLTVGLKIGSLLRGKVDYHDIFLDRPIIRILVDAQGHTNIPQTPATGKSAQSVFDMAINHISVRNGDIYYNDRHFPLNADVYDLQATSQFMLLSEAYGGSLSYRQGRVQFGAFSPLEHDFDAQFSAVPSGMTLKSLNIRSGSSSVSVNGNMKNYTMPTVDVSFHANFAMNELRRVMKVDSLPSGQVLTDGTVDYQDHPGQPVIDYLSITGKISSPLLAESTSQARGDIRSFAADYRMGNGSVEISNLRGEALGGRVEGHLNITHLATSQDAKAEAKITNVSLDDVRRAARATAHQAGGISGRLNGNVQATWHGSLNDLQVRSDATIAANATTASAAGAGSSTVPVQGALHLAYDGRAQLLTLHNTNLKAPHTNLNLDGTLGGHANLNFRAHSDDLREVDRLASGLGPIVGTPGAKEPQLLGLGGAATFNGSVTGQLRAPQVAGQFSATNLQYRGASFQSLHTTVSLSPSQVALHQGDLETSAQGLVSFDLTVGLRNWSYNEREPIDLYLTANKVRFEYVERLVGFQYPITGILAGNLAFHGSEANPTGQGSIDITQARAWEQPIQSVSVKFQGTGDSINSTLNVATPAGSANGTLNYSPKTETYDAKLNVPGVHLEQLEIPAVQELQLAGVVKASAAGRGTLKDPQLDATVQASKLQIGDQSLNSLSAHASVAHQQGSFDVSSTISGAALQAHGTVNLTGDYETTSNVDSQLIELGPILEAYFPDYGAGIKGQTEVHGTLRGPLKQPDKVEANFEVPTLKLAYQTVEIANAAPIHLEYRAGLLTLLRAELKGTGTDLQLQGMLPIRAPGAFQTSATGSVDLGLVKLYNPQWRGSGQINLDVAAQGALAHPDIHGKVLFANAALGSPDLLLAVEKLNGELDVAGGNIQAKNLTGQVGGGTVTVKGYATYQPAVRFNLGINADTVRVRYPTGIRTLFSGDLSLTGTPASSSLNGEMVIDRVSTTPDFDLATFIDQFSGNAAPPPSSGFEQNMRVNVVVRSSEDLAIANPQMSVQGYADLRVQGTAADPVIVGRTTLTGGELFYQGKRFQLEDGTITFVNPVETEPVVRLMVTTVVNQFNISMNFVGPIDRLRTNYTSDPPLSPVDIINLLVTGQTTQAAQASPSTPQSLLAQGMAGQVSSRVQKLAGISSLTIDPQFGGNQGNGASTVAIQQRVTKNLLFTFATDVTSTQGELVQFQYQVTKKYSLSGTRNQAGGYQLEIKMHKVF